MSSLPSPTNVPSTVDRPLESPSQHALESGYCWEDNAISNDGLSPTEATISHAFAHGRNTWTGLRRQAEHEENIGGQLDLKWLRTDLADRDHPQCPKAPKVWGDGTVQAVTEWNIESAQVGHFWLQFELKALVTRQSLVSVSLGNTIPPALERWFGKNAPHFTLLFLAWSYVFASRWLHTLAPADTTEGQSRTLAYYHGRPLPSSLIFAKDGTTSWKGDEKDVVVDLRDLPPQDVRWWYAILNNQWGWSPRQMNFYNLEKYRPPWEVRVRHVPEKQFKFIHTCEHGLDRPPVDAHQAPGARLAMQMIGRYVLRHSLVPESRVAFIAALLVPLVRAKGVTITLPMAQPPDRPDGNTIVHDTIKQHRLDPWPQCWGRWDNIDKLLTMSCNYRGMDSLLRSVFWNPRISSNVCGAWLFGSHAALIGVGPSLLGRMMVSRNPDLGPLWLGAIAIGIKGMYLEHPRCMLGHFEIHEAVWTNTMMSFLQLTQQLSLAGAPITRANEARFRFWCQPHTTEKIGNIGVPPLVLCYAPQGRNDPPQLPVFGMEHLPFHWKIH